MPVYAAPQGLTEVAALQMLKAALTAAHELAAPSGVAIVDTSGSLRAWAVMDGAMPIVNEIVPKKARTAAFTGQPTGFWPAEVSQALQAASETFVILPGGLPIVVDDVVVGGIGAGGTTWDNDVAIAQAGLDGFLPP